MAHAGEIGRTLLVSGAILASIALDLTSAQGDACDALKSASFDHTRIASTKAVGADTTKDTPAYCEVVAAISPVANSNIGAVYRLPERWNGKMLGLGGGGWAGNTNLNVPGLKAGYATAQTDMGHPLASTPADIWRPDVWGVNPEALTDFHYRATHEMTVVAKQVVARYYGKPQTKAYFQGCSTGGRQGMMEVQRFPDDYDGVVSMAPVYNLTVQTTMLLRDNIVGATGAAVPRELAGKVKDAVLKACDAQDGIADGILADPRQCTWDPGEMQCKAGQSADCLTNTQADALRAVYRGVKAPDGRYVSGPLSRGNETGWRAVRLADDATHAGGLGVLTGPVLGDPNFDLSKFDPARDFAVARSSAFAKAYEANDPNIAAFIKHGGKLLLWHGWNDWGPSPWMAIDYFEQVNKAIPNAASSVRLFMAPGVEHCSGGVGADQFDGVGALDAWVQSGTAPSRLVAARTRPQMTRPLCAYPAVPQYKGSGDPNAAESFDCR